TSTHLAIILTPRGFLGKGGRRQGQSPDVRRRRAPDSPGGGPNGADRTVIGKNGLVAMHCVGKRGRESFSGFWSRSSERPRGRRHPWPSAFTVAEDAFRLR